MIEPHLKLELWSRADAVVVVRQTLAALAECLSLEPADHADAATVVTEACNNVVVHAYPEGTPGPMNVAFAVDGPSLLVDVTDGGRGMTPRAHGRQAAGGLGIPMMVALATSVQFADGPQRGTTVELTFDLGLPTGALGPAPRADAGRLLADEHLAEGGTVLTGSPATLAELAMRRVARLLAGRARFTPGGLEAVDRITGRIARELADGQPGKPVRCGLLPRADRLELLCRSTLAATARTEPGLVVDLEPPLARAALAAT